MHPAHGAGRIVDERKDELVDGYGHYYVIEFLRKKLKIFLPVERAEAIGLRSVMGAKRLDRVWTTLRDLPQSLPKHFRTRKAKLEEMLSSGRPTQVARAVRELTWRKSQRDLCKTDAGLLSKAKKRLTSEIVLSLDSTPHKAERLINEALAEAIQAKEQQLQKAA